MTTHMSASNSLSSLSNFYQNNNSDSGVTGEIGRSERRSVSPDVNPGSPEVSRKGKMERERSTTPTSVGRGKCVASEDESENIQV